MNLHLFSLTYALVLTFSSLRCASSQGQVPLTAEVKADLLRACYNTHYNGTPSTFEDFLGGFNTSLYLHEVFSSARRSELPMTIFVGATLERLPALEAQCRSYPGPLSAAIYVPLLQTQRGPQLSPETAVVLSRATARIKELFTRLNSPPDPASVTASPTTATATATPSPTPPPACALTVLLLYEVVSDRALTGLVPINSLRNAALLATDSPLVAMVDVDLAPSVSLGERVLAEGSREELLRNCSQRSVWVLPAWETHSQLGVEEGSRVAERALRGDKASLRPLERDSLLYYFAKLAYSRGHAATNFSRWLDSDEPYIVQYDINYEPWFIMSRDLVPPYDVRFRGYGWNKVQQVALVALSNFTFWVHPEAWLVHRPHEKSRGQQLYGGGDGGRRSRAEVREWRGTSAPVARLFHRRVQALRHTSIRDMRKGTYVAAVEPQTRHCRRELPWWQGVENQAWEPGRGAG